MKKLFAFLLAVIFVMPTSPFVFADTQDTYSFSFENVNNGTAVDNTNESITAVLNQSAILTTGICGNGIFLDGNGANISVAYNTAETYTTSYVLWFKPKVTNVQYGVGCIISDSGRLGLYYDYQTNKIKLSVTTTEDVYEITPDYTFKNDMWYHAVISYDADNVGLYINKNHIANITVSGTLSKGAGVVYGTDSQNHFRGCVDEISYYNQSLSSTQINKLYADAIGKAASVATDFPLTSMYPDGIVAADSELFNNEEFVAPIETGFENREEVFTAYSDDFEGQLSISEDKYGGKFALQIHQKKNQILPIRESEYFHVGKIDDSDTPISIYTEEGKIVVLVQSKSNSAVTAKIFSNGQNLQEEMSTITGSDGMAELVSKTLEPQTYSVLVSYYPSNNAEDMVENTYEISVTDNDLYLHTEIIEPETIKLRSNIIRLKIKPMENTENVSFYTKAQIEDASGTFRETYVMIKSDFDGDGVYKVGEDLSRGKWQEIELDLQTIDQTLINTAASGIYACANIGSIWLFDDIEAEYRKLNEQQTQLQQFTVGNVVYDNGLRFKSIGEETYDNTTASVSGTMKTSGKIAGIEVDEGALNIASASASEKEIPDTVFTANFANDDCMVYENGYNETYTGTSRKEAAVYARESVPVLPAANTTTISIDGEKEAYFRLIFSVRSYDFVISDCVSGETVTYKPSNEYYYSEWYSNDIILSMSNSSYYLSNYITIRKIQYQKKGDNKQEIILSPGGVSHVKIDGMQTDKRTKLDMSLSIEKFNTSLNYTLPVNFQFYEYGMDEPYFSTHRTIHQQNENKQEISFIGPVIKPNTILEIVNLDTSSSSKAIRISNLQLRMISENDWSLDAEMDNVTIESITYYKDIEMRDVLSDEDMKIVEHPDATGVTTAISDLPAGNYIFRYINLNDSLTIMRAKTGITAYTETALEYGENDAYISYWQLADITIPKNVYIISIKKCASSSLELSTYENLNTSFTVDGLDVVTGDYALSEDTDTMYYANYYDHQYLYKYDFNTKEYTKLFSEPVSTVKISPNGKLCIVKCSGIYKQIDLFSGDVEEIGRADMVMYSPLNELYSICVDEANGTITLKQYINGEERIIESINTKYTTYYACKFDPSGKYLLFAYRMDSNNMYMKIYEQTNGMWNVKKLVRLAGLYGFTSSDGYLTPDIARYYASTIVDLNTGTYTNNWINVVYSGKDILISKEDLYYLIDPMTGEKRKLFTYETPTYKAIAYNPDSNIITCILPSGNVIRTLYSGKQTDVKYLLSFDGKKTWSSYADGRWIVASEKNQPSNEELINFGMSANEINALTSSDMSKLYTHGTDILTVDIAIYMNSNSNKVTPYIKEITVLCYDKLEERSAYSKNIKVFDKSEYKTIESLFPIEDFRQNAECYYLLYLGNDWLYTYSDGYFVKVIETADELLKDIDESWVVFKQYGMTASQVRNIPADMLTDLLANPNYANSEFGLIYVIKSDEGTDKCVVDIHIKGYSDYLNNEDVVVEITLNGNDKKIIASPEFSTETIEKLLTWIQMRQNGSGAIFYNVKSQTKQYLINYYMISSINIYSAAEYEGEQSTE